LGVILNLVADDTLVEITTKQCPKQAGNNAWWGLVRAMKVAVTVVVELLREALFSWLRPGLPTL